jgi:hypothetical protein
MAHCVQKVDISRKKRRRETRKLTWFDILLRRSWVISVLASQSSLCQVSKHERKWFTPLLHFDVTLHNLIADYFSSPRNFNETWDGPIFQESESETESEVDPIFHKSTIIFILSFLNSIVYQKLCDDFFVAIVISLLLHIFVHGAVNSVSFNVFYLSGFGGIHFWIRLSALIIFCCFCNEFEI